MASGQDTTVLSLIHDEAPHDLPREGDIDSELRALLVEATSLKGELRASAQEAADASVALTAALNSLAAASATAKKGIIVAKVAAEDTITAANAVARTTTSRADTALPTANPFPPSGLSKETGGVTHTTDRFSTQVNHKRPRDLRMYSR